MSREFSVLLLRQPALCRKAVFLLFLTILSVPLTVFAASGGDAITGLWEVAEGDGRIEIFRCADKYCGRIAWVKEPLYPADDKGGMGGRPLLDRENPKKELASRPQLGLKIMEGYTFQGGNFWDNGTIYNTENGKTYRSNIKLQSPDRLELRGFIGIPLFGGSTVWRRIR